MTTPTVIMLAPPTFGGVVTNTPSGTTYTANANGVVEGVLYSDIPALDRLGFVITNAAASISIGTITLGASPATYVNNDGFTEGVVITGGTVSAVGLIRGTTTIALDPAAGIEHTLSPGDSLVVTYSGAPTAVNKVPR